MGCHELPIGLDIGDLDGLADHSGATDGALTQSHWRPLQSFQVFRCDLVRGPRVKGLRSLVELVEDSLVASGHLDRATHDGGEDGLKFQR